MELALNLVWVCVAIAGVLALAFTLSRAETRARQSADYGRKIIAMGCALVILFFVISMTDDLHDQEVLIEERKISRITAGTEIASHPESARSVPVDLLLFFPPVVFSLNAPSASRWIDASEFLFEATNGRNHDSGRAPPISFA